MQHEHPAAQKRTGSLHALLNFVQNRIFEGKKRYQVPDLCTEIVHTQCKLVHTQCKIVHTQKYLPYLGRKKFR